MIEDIFDRFRAFPGDASLYYRPLDGSEPVAIDADMPLIAASVIKIPVMIEAFRQFEEGLLSPDKPVAVRPEHKMPSCGALSYMHDNLTVTVMDLVTLMIILSDNTATNLLIDMLGIENINGTLSSLGCEKTRIARKLFDREGMRKGLKNLITAREIGMLLEKIHRGEAVGEQASQKMLEILKNQRLNGKIPFFLYRLGVKIAHKTGEEDGISHDAAIVFAERPFVMVALSNNVDVPQFERLIQDAALALYGQNITKVLRN
ncbi:MAG: serine hydrolase [Clostridiales bacterium]|nr:serine hydrolase [Clostridiales bacterium]